MKIIQQIEYEEKRSRFIAYHCEVKNKEESDAILKSLAEQHPKARHILRACRFENQFGVMISEMCEDREPISSMKKVKDLLERKDIKYVGIYIVRYYGGTNLGASRLDHVYFSLACKFLDSQAK